MYKYNCLLIDDNQEDLDYLESVIKKYNRTNDKGINLTIVEKVRNFNDAVDIIGGEKKRIDLIFLDLMYGESLRNDGQSLLNIIQKSKEKVIVISGHTAKIKKQDYKNVIGYIDKTSLTIDDNKLFRDIVGKFWAIKEGKRARYTDSYVELTIIENRKSSPIIVNYADIAYVISGNKEIIIKLLNGKSYTLDADRGVALTYFPDIKGGLKRISNHVIINIADIKDVECTSPSTGRIFIRTDNDLDFNVTSIYKSSVTLALATLSPQLADKFNSCC